MPNDLYSAVDDFDKSQAKKVREYSGILGLPTSTKTVKVPNRNNYVYVRLRDSNSEIIQAFNDKVSPVFNLPVIVVRYGAGWRIKDRDIDRYSDWGSTSPFLPEHHFQHEFNPDAPGGDVVFVYQQQFMPAIVSPSGTGAINTVLHAYPLKHGDGSWARVGNTGTQSLITYKPADNQAIIGLVYLNRDTGNPGVLVNSGTPAAATITGTHELLQYLPSLPTNDYEPLAMFRLVSGTSKVEWGNLYDIRQFFSGMMTGTGGGIEEAPIDGIVYGRKNAGWVEVSGTGGTPTFDANRVVITDNTGAQTVDRQFYYDYENNVLVIGYNPNDVPDLPPLGSNNIQFIGSGVSPAFNLYAFGNDIAGFNAFFRARGDVDNPSAILHGDVIGRAARFRGYDGVDWSVTQAEIRGQARGNWDSSSHGTDIVMGITASGTTTLQDFVTVNQSGMDILSGAYKISGSALVSINILSTFVYSQAVPASTTYYGYPSDNELRTGATNYVLPVGGVIKNLAVKTANAQPASGSMVVTLYKGGVATSLTITIGAGAAANIFQDNTNEVSVAAGDQIRLVVQNNATANSAAINSITMLMETLVTG